jgi:hypothetical protein
MLVRDVLLKCVSVENKRSLRPFEDDGRDVELSKVGELDSTTWFISSDVGIKVDLPLLRRDSLVLNVLLMNILSGFDAVT